MVDMQKRDIDMDEQDTQDSFFYPVHPVYPYSGRFSTSPGPFFNLLHNATASSCSIFTCSAESTTTSIDMLNFIIAADLRGTYKAQLCFAWHHALHSYPGQRASAVCIAVLIYAGSIWSINPMLSVRACFAARGSSS